MSMTFLKLTDAMDTKTEPLWIRHDTIIGLQEDKAHRRTTVQLINGRTVVVEEAPDEIMAAKI